MTGTDGGGGQRPDDVRVVLYGRPGCHLCETAREVVARVCADLGQRFEEVDVSGDAALLAAYGEEIPVTLVDGQRHDFWRVDEARLRHTLTAGR